jgi:hypothetical protein
MDARTASKTERHFASDIPDIGNPVPDIASAPASAKNRFRTAVVAEKEDCVPRFIESAEGLGEAKVMIDTPA